MVKSRISILVSLVFMGGTSDVQNIAEHGKDTVRGNDRGNAGYDSTGCGLTDRGGTFARLHAPETAGAGHEESKESSLGDAEQEALQLDCLDSPVEIHGGRDVQHAGRHDQAAGDADEVRKGTKK